MPPRLLALILVCCTAAIPAMAQTLVIDRGAPPPRLMQSKAEKPIELQTLRINSEISGGMAETTVLMVFYNPNSRQLEGDLQFPLQDGQQISAFALDINGEMRPAVTVEKAKGRKVFEEIERQRVDPALLEQTQGNNFKLRVYPIAARGTRTVELKYTQALARTGAHWNYRLPLGFGESVKEFDLTLKVHGVNVAPSVGGQLGAVDFKRTANGYQAQVLQSRFTPRGELTLDIAAAAEPRSYVQVRDGETWFVAEVPVPAAHQRRVLPRTVGLLWDSSGSGAARAHAAELVELDHYFKAMKNGEVRLTRLRDRAEAVTVFPVVDGKWDALRMALESTVYDGASALAEWQPQADVGEYLLVSDGLVNYGAARFPVLGAQQRLYALNSSMTADTTRLAELAGRTGGRLAQVDPQKPGKAAAALLAEGVNVGNVRAVGASDILFESRDPQNGLVRVAGKLLNPTARLTLSLGQNGRSKDIDIIIDAKATPHPMAAQLWASYQLRALEADYEMNRMAIRRLGTKFSIPTRETSLIVLDRIEDYVRYAIAPPPSMMAEYERLSNLRDSATTDKRKRQLDSVVRQFQVKKDWWEKTWPKNRPEPKKLQKSNDAPGMEPMPVAVAAPAPAMAAAASDMQEVQVTGSRVSRSFARTAKTGVKGMGNAEMPAEIGMTLKKWRSDAPYIARMNAASPESMYRVYLDEKPSYLNSSAFYVDVADMMLEKGQRELALRVLSNLVEMDLENRAILRILGYRLLQAGAPELAIKVFEKVLYLAEEEPQSFRDLGLAHAAAGHHQQAIDQLNEVVIRTWDGRFAEIELIALGEINAIIANAPARLDTSRIDERLLKNMPLAVRAVLTWDSDNSDMDLHVVDPDGERSFYGNQLTYQGGRMSRDFTGGYGPEEFALRFAKPGKYKIEANFYGTRQQIVAGATTLQVKLSTGFGTARAKDQMMTLRLSGDSRMVVIGEFEVKKP
jgi:Ca-activated chloride channel family protein